MTSTHVGPHSVLPAVHVVGVVLPSFVSVGLAPESRPSPGKSRTARPHDKGAIIALPVRMATIADARVSNIALKHAAK